jgi:hypothetical protein
LKPDLLIFDREENPKFMAEQSEIPFHATHVTGLADMPKSLREMGEILKNSELAAMAGAWEKILAGRPAPGFPGLIEEPTGPYTQAVYLIWKDPWMAAGSGTFIASVLDYLGVEMLRLDGKYPKIDLTLFPKDTLLIFSSEPYPFLKKREGLAELGFPIAFADGEKFSWFGVRAQRFLTSSCATR